MANRDILKEAIADAKSIKEAAIANAKVALEEAFTPYLKEKLSAKLAEIDAMDEEMDEDPEQVRRAEQYAQEMYDYHKPLPSDRVYGKNEMIEHDRDDDKY